MGSLGHVVLAIAAIAAAEAGLEHPLAPTWVLLALVPVPALLARLAERCYLRGRLRTGELVHRLLSISPPLLYLAALSLFGWRTAVGRWTGGTATLLDWPDLRVLL